MGIELFMSSQWLARTVGIAKASGMWEAPQVPNPKTDPEMAPFYRAQEDCPIIFPHMWDWAPEVPPTFRTCTTARLVRRHQAFEFFKPVEDDNYFRRHQILLALDHQEMLPIGGDVVTTARIITRQDWEKAPFK